MRANGLSIFDIEHCILNGEIVEKQRDRKTGEGKFVIQGPTIAGDSVAIVAKIEMAGDMVIITVYAD